MTIAMSCYLGLCLSYSMMGKGWNIPGLEKEAVIDYHNHPSSKMSKICSRCWLTQDPWLVNVQRIRDCGALRSRGDICITPLLSELREEGLERFRELKAVANYSKKCFLDGAGKLYIWAHRGCDSIHKTWATLNQTKSQHGKERWVQCSIPSSLLRSCW